MPFRDQSARVYPPLQLLVVLSAHRKVVREALNGRGKNLAHYLVVGIGACLPIIDLFGFVGLQGGKARSAYPVAMLDNLKEGHCGESYMDADTMHELDLLKADRRTLAEERAYR